MLVIVSSFLAREPEDIKVVISCVVKIGLWWDRRHGEMYSLLRTVATDRMRQRPAQSDGAAQIWRWLRIYWSTTDTGYTGQVYLRILTI